MRARGLAPNWLESMEEHDSEDAGDLSTTVDVVLGWDATAGMVSDRRWADVASTFAFDRARRERMHEVNSWALESTSETLLEATDRDLCNADERGHEGEKR